MLDTFSGIGGFSLAARWLGGFDTVQFVERDPYCQRVLAKHWPTVPIHDDICTFNPERGSADVVVGGFPCQDISKAGKGAGIQHGTRSGLFYELIRVIRLVRPQFVVLENVAAILANGLDIVLGELAEAGYDAEWACIQAADVGACHWRDRWWCVAFPATADANGSGLEGRQPAGMSERPSQRTPWPSNPPGGRLNPDWRSDVSEPVLRGGDARLSGRVDRLKALGNAVVPQCAAIPLARVKQLSTPQDGLARRLARIAAARGWS